MIDAAWIRSPLQQIEVWAEHRAQPVCIAQVNHEVASGRTYFEWSEAARGLGMNLSPLTLPLGVGVWSDHAGSLPRDFEGLPGLLNDALPDDWGRYLMNKAMAQQQIEPGHITPLARLLYLADRAWGALTFRPMFDRAAGESVALEQLAEEVEAAIEGHVDEVSAALLRAGSSPQGARPKIMVDLDADMAQARISGGPPPPGYDAWLINFAARNEPTDAPILEQAYMECAWHAGITVMECRLLSINGRPAFATRRYDRSQGRRIHCHTLGGLLHRSHRQTGLDYAHIAAVMSRLQVPQQDYSEAYARAAFNVAMSVRDDHVKNFAFMRGDAERWMLSPAYDLTYMDGPGGHHTMTFAGGTTRDPTRADLLRLAAAYGVAAQEAGDVVTRMRALPAHFERIALGYGADRATVKQIGKRLAAVAKALA